MTLNCSDPWRMRLLETLADESARLGAEVAQLGDAVTGGTATVMVLQGFDALSQAAYALARVLERLCATRLEILDRIEQVPLPAMRHRLRAALDPEMAAAPDDGAAIWLETP